MNKFALLLNFFFNLTISFNYLNIPSIEHSHSNLPNSKPMLESIHMTNFQVLKEQKIGHAIRRSVLEKPILAKLVKSLII